MAGTPLPAPPALIPVRTLEDAKKNLEALAIYLDALRRRIQENYS